MDNKMVKHKLTLYDVVIGDSQLYKVDVRINGETCEITDYRLKFGSNRISYRPELSLSDRDLIFKKAKEKYAILQGFGII